MSHSTAEHKMFVRKLLLSATMASLVGAGCEGPNKCEELRDIAVERNEWCGAGENITMGDLECPPQNAWLAECVIPCFQLSCAVSADEFNECLDGCG